MLIDPRQSFNSRFERIKRYDVSKEFFFLRLVTAYFPFKLLGLRPPFSSN